jgi:hypothetical protein
MSKAKALPSQEQLHGLFDYSIVEGNFYRKTTAGGKKAGSLAGYLHKGIGYHQVKVEGSQFQAHRLAWMYVTGEDPGELHVDHIDGDRTNNAFHNLQLLTNQQNSARRHKSTGGVSQYRGVTLSKNARLWRAQMKNGGKMHRLGYYKCEKEAAIVAWLYSHRVFHKGYSNYEMP